MEYTEADDGGQRESDARTEWSIAACDSWMAQLEETDNPQSAGDDKTAPSLLGGLDMTSPGSAPPLLLSLHPSLVLSL